MADDIISIEGETVEARTPEGATSRIPVQEFIERVAPAGPNLLDLVPPDGVRSVRTQGTATIIVYEIPPQVHRLKWISNGSRSPFGLPGAPAEYQERRLALPYLVLFAVFADYGGRLMISGHNEAYFRTEPITSLDDELCLAALLNVSQFPAAVAGGRPLSWICTQHARFAAFAGEKDDSRRVRACLAELRRTTLETGFNYSSEHHELTSCWTLSKEAVPEVADIDRWEALSREDPLFVLNVKWLPATWKGKRMTVRTLSERIFKHAREEATVITTAADVARVIHNGGRRRRREAPHA